MTATHRPDGDRPPSGGQIPHTTDGWQTFGQGYLPGLIGIELREVARGRVTSRLRLRKEHLAPNGYLHGATVIALAETSCGYGTVASLPDSARGFTTIEIKANYLGTVLEGAIGCEAMLIHAGRTTQVWDAKVTDEATARVIALFRCTQIVLYPT
jgi:1,4-dihydroxy-2-naphthoyl-CoA hydrolase